MPPIRLIAGVLRGLPMPVLAVDGKARVLAANSAAEQMLGDDVLDRPFVTVLRNPMLNEALERVLAAPQTEVAVSEKLSAQIAAQGRDLNCDISVTALEPGLGHGALISLTDTTRMAQAEQMRRDFVANVSHELRTPLTALLGFIETLRGPARNDPVARDRFLSIMEREAGRMNRLVADLLSLSRVEADERRRPAERLDLALLVRGSAAALSGTAEIAGTQIVLEGLETPVWISGDQDQLVQVFQNLVENALKYGGSGGSGGSGGPVTLRLRRIDHEPVLRGPAWAVEVEDQGDGIDAFHLPRLTERFYRVDTHRSREKGGTGLGLAIVKHIVSRHRGRLRIESEKGQGSRFTVILPDPEGARGQLA